LKKYHAPPKNKNLPRYIQQLNMDKRTKVAAKDSNLCFTWEGNFRPTKISASYKVILSYQDGTLKVLLDGIGKEDFGTIPHIFPDGSLCLYYKGFKPILCWIDEWLFYFEIWKSSGIWLGGGIGHESKKREL
jgi:hypothetical protein